jgi:hypothetical protein
MSDNYLDVQVVCSKLAAAGVYEDEIGKVYAARQQPEHLDDTEKKFVMAAKTAEGEVMLVVYRFGLGQPLVKRHPLDEGGPDWRPRFLAVEGPFQLVLDANGNLDPACELATKAKELTASA